MSSEPGTPTLDQLRVFLTVVETGSFAAAARKLNRATSVVSYSIANLEAQLGVSLFDRVSTRKPQLTDSGRTVLAEARTIYGGGDGLLARGEGRPQGVGSEVQLAPGVLLAGARVAGAAQSVPAECPNLGA